VARRIDFYDDPAAPAANSLVPSVNVVVTNSDSEVLLIRRSDNQNWAVPGGAIDLGESMVQAAVRETKEETGVDCSIILTARATSGVPTPGDESTEVRWVPQADLGSYSMDRSMRLRIDHFLEGRVGPYLG
jgi:8-oxo-dGTP pyrophosphatase MutT (NUDIX family)